MKECDFGKILLAFIGGAAAGIAIGMLFAPDKGSETRKKIAQKAKTFSGNINETLSNLKGRAEELIEEISDLTQSIEQPELEEEGA